MGTELELSHIDQAILRYADSESPEEIANRLGGVVTPERIMAIKEELLKSKKWLTLAQKEEIVLLKMNAILAKLEGQYLDLDNAKVQLSILKEIGNRLDKRLSATQVDLETYDMNVARAMSRAFDVALGYMKGALRGEINEDLWDEVAKDALAHAGREAAKDAIEE